LHRGFCRDRHKRRREPLTLILGFYGLAESVGNDLDESRDWTSPSIRATSAGMAAATTGEKSSPCSKQSAVRGYRECARAGAVELTSKRHNCGGRKLVRETRRALR
jgi:hypothetical protein